MAVKPYKLGETIRVCSIEKRVGANRSYRLLGIVGNPTDAELTIEELIEHDSTLSRADFRVTFHEVCNPLIEEE